MWEAHELQEVDAMFQEYSASDENVDVSGVYFLKCHHGSFYVDGSASNSNPINSTLVSDERDMPRHKYREMNIRLDKAQEEVASRLSERVGEFTEMRD